MNRTLEDKKWANWLIQQLRRISYKWPERTKAKNRGRIERGLYRCNTCKQVFTSAAIQLDHIEPVIDPGKGFDGWDAYINRLFGDAEGLQVLCRPCHKTKTNKENAKRRLKKEMDSE